MDWAEMVYLTIYDLAGRIVHQQATNFKAGYHEIPIQAKQLPADQILYYQLKTDQHMATRKMLLQRQ
ncbi:MAG: hypothetical protein AAFP19_15270 [Bacteroidota bacterium]